MSYELTGKLEAIFETVQRTPTFKTREFVVEKTEMIGDRPITNYIKFQAVQDKTALLDKVKPGDEIKVSFNLKGSKWSKDDREGYITNLDAWRIEQVLQGGTVVKNDTEEPRTDTAPTLSSDAVPDDLPF